MSSKIDKAIRGELIFPKGFGSTLKNKDLDKNKSVCGFDIEADSITAEPFLLTFSTPEYTSFIIPKEPGELLDFFTRHQFRESVNFFHNLQYDFEGLLKLFHKEISLSIYGNGHVFLSEKGVIEEENKSIYRLSYIQKKAFHVKVIGHKKYSYFDSLQYYQMSLDNAAKKYLGKEKKDFSAKYSSKALFENKTTIENEIERFEEYYSFIYEDNKQKEIEISKMKAFFSRFSSSENYRELMLEYALEDSRICRELGILLVNGINDFVNSKNFNSTATLSEYYFRSNNIHVPKLPDNVFKKFMENYNGGRFEICYKGLIPNVSMYDKKSAYPHAMSLMPILSKNPICRNVYHASERALYGSYRIVAHIPEDLFLSPLTVKGDVLKFPTGRYNEYWTDKLTLEFLDELDFKYKIIDGVEIYDDNADYRLTPLILKLYEIKENKKNSEVIRFAAKIILNSLYGKFIQLVDDTTLELVESLEELDDVWPSNLFNIKNEIYKRVHNGLFKTGKLFAPQYGSFITAHTRIDLYRQAWKLGLENIVGFHTDSIMIKDKMMEENNVLGGWELEMLKSEDGKIKIPLKSLTLALFKSGMYEVESQGLRKIRSRGIGKTDTLFANDFMVNRRYGLKQAIKKDFHEMNIISPMKIENDINGDLKRIWKDTITIDEVRAGKMISSMPFTTGNKG